MRCAYQRIGNGKVYHWPGTVDDVSQREIFRRRQFGTGAAQDRNDDHHRPRSDPGTERAMSLAPAERRALARIEDSLCRSDPGLARMLTRFRLPITRGGWTIAARRPRRARLLVPLILAVTVALCVLAILPGPHRAPPSCGVGSGPGPATAAARFSDCPTANHTDDVARHRHGTWPSVAGVHRGIGPGPQPRVPRRWLCSGRQGRHHGPVRLNDLDCCRLASCVGYAAGKR